MLILKDFTFDAAHRLVKDYPGKCRWLHGHTYKVEVAVRGSNLDKYGMLIDFDAIKQQMQDYVNVKLDHGTFVVREDKVLLDFLNLGFQKHFVLEGATNATAEAIAAHLHTTFQRMLLVYCKDRTDADPDLKLDWVRVWETPTSSAVAHG